MKRLRVRNIGYLAMEKHIPNAAQLQRRIHGLSYETVKRLWHGGALKYIPIRELEAIANELGIGPLELLIEVEEPGVESNIEEKEAAKI